MSVCRIPASITVLVFGLIIANAGAADAPRPNILWVVSEDNTANPDIS